MDAQTAYKLLSENLTSIYGYAYSRLYDQNRADELASDIVYEILSSVKNLQSDEAFWGYVWKIAENTFRRFIRRADLSAQPVEFTEETVGVYEPSPEEDYVRKETESEEVYLLRRELSLLKKTHREVCVAYYVDHKNCSQIAKEQGVSPEMVKYHLFKTRKLLKEGIGMTRQLGEKSYNPGIFRLNFWGDVNKYDGFFKRKLPGSILLSAYYEPMTAEALSMELGVAMPYLEDELEILEAAGVIKKHGEKYQTNIVIVTDAYEKAFVKSTSGVYPVTARSVFGKVKKLLPQIREFDFRGNDFNENRLLFGILNIAFVQGFHLADEKSPIGEPNELALGGHGWIYGHDNDCANHHFLGVTMNTCNPEGTAWFSAENYRIIQNAQRYDHYNFFVKAEAMWDVILSRVPDRENPMLPWLIEQNFICRGDNALTANFPVFDTAVFDQVCLLLSDVVEEVADCMIGISDQAEKILSEHAPDSVKSHCGDIAKIHHRLDAAAFLFESLIEQKMLFVPDEKVPLCVWGVRNRGE